MFPEYTLKNNGVTIATAITALQLKAGTAGPIEILRASCSQIGTVTSAQVSIALLRKTAAATVTIAVAGTHLVKTNPIAPTANAELSTTATGITATGEGTNGDIDVQRGFNVMQGFEWLPSPEERIIIPAAGFFAMTFFGTVPSATWYCDITFRELRGS